MQHATDGPKDGSIKHGGKAGSAKGTKNGGKGGRGFKFGRIAPSVQDGVANKGKTAKDKEKGANVKDSVAFSTEVLSGVGHVGPIERCEVVRRKVSRFLVDLTAKIATLAIYQLFCHS